MRDIKRIPKLLDSLEELWMSKQEHDLRFGQLICLLINRLDEVYGLEDIFEIEDDKWQSVIDDLVKLKKEFKTDRLQ